MNRIALARRPLWIYGPVIERNNNGKPCPGNLFYDYQEQALLSEIHDLCIKLLQNCVSLRRLLKGSKTRMYVEHTARPKAGRPNTRLLRDIQSHEFTSD